MTNDKFARAHSAWLEPPEPKVPAVFAQCLHDKCRSDIFEDEYVYEIPGAGYVHDDCAAEFAIQMIGAKRRVA